MTDNKIETEKIPVPEDGIGDRIRIIRESKKLSHDGLSSLTKICDLEKKGISRTTIRGYELGTFKPGTREIRVLSEALEVSPSFLIIGAPDSDKDFEKTDANSQDQSKPIFSFGKGVQTVWAFLELASEDKEIVRQLVLTLVRHKIGEVEFRKLDGVSTELGELIDDMIRDHKDGAAFDLDPIKNNPLIIDTMKRMSKKYGFDFPVEDENNLNEVANKLS